ncbi:MAG TPA: deoxynucleoside kinase [Woeseiaceae bacterium]|nr:deoxynucleoside kinase [Woeseiaceae bacterium]
MSEEKVQKAGGGPRFIVVEGPIGVGKTSLSRRLAESFGGEVLLEHVEANPFLERFYRSGRSAALPAQLFFLFQRARQLEELRQSDLFSRIRIADFHFAKDRLFAEINLDREEMSLYEQISERLQVEPPVPDLVVYLQASVDALMQRIGRRGIAYERMIDRSYLEKLTDAYARYFHRYDDGPLLIVNASSIDPIHNDADYEQLFRQIERTTGGRHFFNPAAAVALA